MCYRALWSLKVLIVVIIKTIFFFTGIYLDLVSLHCCPMFGRSTIFALTLVKALGVKFHIDLIHFEDQCDFHNVP